jgi:hypothetical protein
VLKVLLVLIPHIFLNRFFFIQGDVNNVPKHSKWNFTRVPLLFKGFETSVLCLPWKEDQTLLTNNEPNNVFWNPNRSVFFLNHLGDICCQRTRCNDWTSHFICGNPWLNCHLPRQFKFIMTIWSNILSLIWVPLRRIIIGSSNIWIMIMVLFAITNHL